MQTLEELNEEFFRNVDQIAADLLTGFGLKHSGDVDGLHVPLLRWMDFRLRTIDPRPRQIYASDRFPKSLDEPVASALQSLERAIRNGEDINPFQSKGCMPSANVLAIVTSIQRHPYASMVIGRWRSRYVIDFTRLAASIAILDFVRPMVATRAGIFTVPASQLRQVVVVVHR